MKVQPSEYYRYTDRFIESARAYLREAEKTEQWARGLLERAGELQAHADAHGIPDDAADQLGTFRRLLEEGPPDGSPIGGEAAQVKTEVPNVQRRERQACSGCGLKRGHKAGCAPPAPVVENRSAIQERRDDVRAAEDERVKLAGQLRAYRENVNPSALPSEIAGALSVPLVRISDAWPLLTGEKAP
jgi:hypothetical protein